MPEPSEPPEPPEPPENSARPDSAQKADSADSADSAHSSAAGTPAAATADSAAESARREFARLLGEFRRTAVLVPFDEHDGLWTADRNGVRWICAFSHEEALARFAAARGEARREWRYRTVLGARLLDVLVPALPGPGGVALDAGSADGMLFPPVRGIVPDTAAVDLGEEPGEEPGEQPGERGDGNERGES
ncbi:SseB family protein [Streptomyces spongiicola]|uniref:SseB family protein n=1 Tax=Streptomyces spongiicola TaxID=1690221 RepID=UPI0021CEF5CF|nr:SseB family protein [Streptomyces spongiicola]